MMSPREQVARLWELVWDDQRLACSIYRIGGELVLTLESHDAVILDERFGLEPRAVSKAHALREDLKRRGWQTPPSRP